MSQKKKSTKISLQILLIATASLLYFVLALILVFPYKEPNSKSEVKGTFNFNVQVPEAEAEEKLYTVTEVSDGDTIKIDIDGEIETVRLVGIDTPELHHPTIPVQCFAQEAFERARSLLLEQKVRVKNDGKQGERDRYGRLLLYLYLPQKNDEDIFVNDSLVREGYAYAYTKIDSDYLEQFQQAEAEARNNSRGLWASCKCSKGEEISRECVSCNQTKVEYNNWDCTTYTEKTSDNNCYRLCPASSQKNTKTTPPPSPEPDPTPTTPWDCDCSKTCSEMSSCEEAQYQLTTCGCSVRDGDNDGIACDKQCQLIKIN